MPRLSGLRLGLDVRLTYYTAGGIAKYVRQLASRLPGLAPQHHFVHFYRRGHTATYAQAAQRVDCWTPAHHRLEQLALSFEVWPQRLNVLHSPDFIPPLGGYRRSIVTVHDLTFLLYPQFLTPDSRAYYNGHIRWAVRRAAAIAADSHATKADLINLLDVPPAKITVVHLGLDPEFCEGSVMEDEATPGVLQRLGLAAGFILFVGTFEPRKNVGGLLRAYARLRANRPDAPQLVLAGRRGWLFEPAQALIHELGLESKVKLLEEVPNEDLPSLYRAAGVCVLPSHYEGFGFPVLEAMASGTPAVIADRASLPEIAGEAALKVDPNQPEAIAEALERALTDSALRAELVRRGREQVRLFTWEKTARETLALYERVAAQ